MGAQGSEATFFGSDTQLLSGRASIRIQLPLAPNRERELSGEDTRNSLGGGEANLLGDFFLGVFVFPGFIPLCSKL